MPNLYVTCNDKLSPYLGAASVDPGGRLFAGGGPREISPCWQARKGVTGGQDTDGNRNGTRSQTIADFFHKNKWVRRIVHSIFRIFVPRPLPRFSVAWGRGYIFQA